MKFTSAVFSIVFFGNGRLHAVDASVFDMNLSNIGYVRTDPLVDQQCLNNHVHAFYGAKALLPNTSYDDLRAVPSDEVSGQIAENKSLYWHPAVYRELSDGTLELQETAMSIYYIWDAKDPNVRAFDPGFAMIAGFEDRISDKADFTFVCEDSGLETDTFQDDPCPGEFFIEFRMPNCWNGQPRDPNDSHVTYSNDGGNDGESFCPPDFFKIPQLWFFVEFPNGYKGGNHVFSDGSSVIHFDYFNGWDERELESALRNCDNNDFGPTGGSVCNQFTYKGEQFSPSTKFDVTKITDEQVDRIPALIFNSDKNPDGSCAAADQPKTGGSSNSPVNNPTLRPTPAPTTAPQPSANPLPSPTQRPTLRPTQAIDEPDEEDPDEEPDDEVSCEDQCELEFLDCDESIDNVCGDETFLPDCQQECVDELDGEELDECLETWCLEDQEICFDDLFKRCRRRRRRCRRRC